MKSNAFIFAANAVFVLCAGLSSLPATAAVSAAEAAKLHGELTPVGAEKAGNKEGTIPPWTGGFLPLVPQVGGRRTDPFPSEKPLFSITASTTEKYADKLTPGILALFKKYPTTFRIDVYPTHRTALISPELNEFTYKSATSAKLLRDADGIFKVEGDSGGVLFPIPQSGAEVIFNHITNYVPPLHATANNYLAQPDGRRILVSTYTNDFMRYFKGDVRLKEGQYLAVHSATTNPPIRAGEQIVGYNYIDPGRDTSWVYLPGQRRIRKLPNSCCDTPTPFSSGIISFDEIEMFYGSPHRFDWKLVGKKEIYVPYNSNIFFTPTKVDDVLMPHHLNPDHVRWELHRVWVIEAKLREGQRHVSPRSTYYVDEDTWQALLSERYDSQGQLARSGYIIPILLTEDSVQWAATSIWHDLLSGAVYMGSIYNEATEQIKVLDTIPRTKLSPDAMVGEGIR